MKDKKNNVLKPFFNKPKHWHFEELLKETDISRPQLTKWLKYFAKKGIIKKIKKKGKMPYYVQNFENPDFKSLKRLYAYQKLTKKGFIRYLLSLKNVESVILFGSFARSDWYKQSDIDLFIYGKNKKIDIAKYEKRLNRNIQLFTCNNKNELKKMGAPLLRNILQGNLIKGTIPKEVIKNAAV